MTSQDGEVKVLAFDTFGTVTDWHTGVGGVLATVFPDLDSGELVREWRRRYPPAMAAVESGSGRGRCSTICTGRRSSISSTGCTQCRRPTLNSTKRCTPGM
ncbi:hypothetical protein [Gordonia humi]|uniref:Uncharacterized protein n=1 Tax=Gordonia humi TaxID=686429 RepID=A0A840EZM3_9ACTN|nr:hypothetical protein [Gordonia humi]